MATTSINFKIKGESPLAGAGFDASGSPVQGKKIVWGLLEVTAYAAAGMDMTLNQIGLSALDHLDMQVATIDDNADGTFTWPASTVHYDAQWAEATNKLFITLSEKAGTAVTAGGLVNVNFLAIGDSATAPELL